ncbi:glycoside hydrolase family 3 N-terminal domain-containing protein [Flavobacterium notoginsengisoli]|uniref:glycoside hydrolase family 3 N-terminal domain-containing protein n=1 Tax=Flavobacterium notoginsengisoli TaxID=1478199 RepID=UPI0036350A94
MKKNIIILSLVFSIVQFNLNAQHSNTPLYITVAGKKFVDLNKNGKLDKYEDTRLSIDVRLNNIVSLMTSEEKCNMLLGMGMSGYNGVIPIVGFVDKSKVPGSAGLTYPIPRLGIPSVVLCDGPAGLRISPKRFDTDKTFYCTAFPVGTALASTWNEELVKNVGKSIGNEVKEYGADVLLAPGLNIQRNPLCGRNFEYYSEDPLVSGKIAAAYVNGVQSNGVGSTVKHFAANNQETNRFGVNEHISERALREIYLKSFEIAIKESQPWAVMSAYNSINGEFASARKDLLTDVLRSEWGFKGVVMTDWLGGYPSYKDIVNKKFSSDVVKQETAGNDLLMPGMNSQKNAMLDAFNNGKLSREIVDQNVKRILNLVFKSQVFTDYKYSNSPDLKAHAQVSRNAANEAITLLRNNSQTLPYTTFSAPVAVFGVTSYNLYAGGTGSGDVNKAYVVSLIEGLNNAGFQLNKEVVDSYTPYLLKLKQESDLKTKEGGGMPTQCFAIPEMDEDQDYYNRAASTSQIGIITLGRNSGEGFDRVLENDYNLTISELKLIDQVSNAFHAKGKKVVVILNVGGVVETASWKDKVDAILLTWQVGQEGGNAIADILSGKVNPSGKLPMTFPVNYTDHASAKNWVINTKVSFDGKDTTQQQVSYEEGIYVGYRYFNTFKVKPSYEFGYGLSYTDFSVSNMQLSNKAFAGKITVTVDVKNTGKLAGKEVLQLYLSAPSKELDKPAEELKAFAKTKLLQPGETQKVKLFIDERDLASYDEKTSSWIAEAGIYKVLIGTSSLNIKQSDSFTLKANTVVEKAHKSFALDIKLDELKK